MTTFRGNARPLVALPALLFAAACGATPPVAGDVHPSHAHTAAAPARPERVVAAKPKVGSKAARASVVTNAAAPTIVVHKSPTCPCCRMWVEHLRTEGFAVDVRETNDLRPVQERVGVPPGKGSCHTGEVAGYFIEGHVPAADIRRLLAEKPKARGLTVPGMPLGSPGMEAPGHEQAYQVELVARDGTTTAFATHGPGADAE